VAGKFGEPVRPVPLFISTTISLFPGNRGQVASITRTCVCQGDAGASAELMARFSVSDHRLSTHIFLESAACERSVGCWSASFAQSVWAPRFQTASPSGSCSACRSKPVCAGQDRAHKSYEGRACPEFLSRADGVSFHSRSLFARSQRRARCATNRWTQHRDSWAGEAVPGPRKNQFELGQPSDGWCSPLAPPGAEKLRRRKSGDTTARHLRSQETVASQIHPERECNLRRGGQGFGVDTAGESLFVAHVARALCFACFNRGLSKLGWHLY
jgi:hypothetical protein